LDEAQCEEFAVRLLVDAMQHGAFGDPNLLQLGYVIRRRVELPRPAWREAFREASVWVNQHLHLVRWAKHNGDPGAENSVISASYRRLAAAVETSANWLAGEGPAEEPDTINWWKVTESAKAFEMLITDVTFGTAKGLVSKAATAGQILARGRGHERRLEPGSVALFLLRQRFPGIDDVIREDSC
jgi:hypothetical protein